MFRVLLICLISICINSLSYSQGCCSGGSSNPMSGNIATGVLEKYQFDFSTSYQYNTSSIIYEGNKQIEEDGFYDKLSSDYLFLKTDYGLSNNLTLSLATGYHIIKALHIKDEDSTNSSSGFGDLIFLPRYSLYNTLNNSIRTEITLGIGLKIPIGSHNDSIEIVPNVWELIPPTIQLSTGGNDLIIYSSFLKNNNEKKIRFFVNTLYIKKGYNSLNDKFGDYASLSFYTGKSFLDNWGITLEIKGEWVGKLSATTEKLNELNLDENYFDKIQWEAKRDATGGTKILLSPQLNYSFKSLTIYALYEAPIYQNLNDIQFGSQLQLTFGLNYRFYFKKDSMQSKY